MKVSNTSIGTGKNNRPVLPLNGRQFNELNYQVTLNNTVSDIGNLDFGNSIPEPATVGILALGSLAFLHRRRCV